MTQNENWIKEAFAVFVWFAAALLLIFIAGLLILQPRADDGESTGIVLQMNNTYDEKCPVEESHPIEADYVYNANRIYFDEEYEYIDNFCIAEEPQPEFHSPFMAYPFFIPENEEIYAKFYAERPDLDAQTVVWMVNVHLHLPFFHTIRVNEDPNPLLVNSFYRLPAGFVPSNLERVTHDNCSFLATPETAAAFRKLQASAREAGFSISLASAFRSAKRQQEIFRERGGADGRIMRPYHSEHQTGRALDLRGHGGLLDHAGPTPAGAWVAKNAHLYGFIMRYLAETTHITGIIHEPWHITYVGLEISTYMNDNGILSLEEFVGRNPGAGLGFMGPLQAASDCQA